MKLFEKIQRAYVRYHLKREMKRLNIPFGKGEDVLEQLENKVNEARIHQQSHNKGRFDELLRELPFEVYEVIATCDTCHDVDIVGASPDLFEALENAKQGYGMAMDDDDVMHFYRTAVVKQNRELIYSPEQVAQEKDLDNK
jgi:hypothetical protein